MKILSKLILGALMFIFLGCTSLFKPYNPSIAFLVYSYRPYAIMENGKFNKKITDDERGSKIWKFIKDEYGLSLSQGEIQAVKNYDEGYIIKFYDDWKVSVNKKEYILPKEKIRETKPLGNRSYLYKLPVDIRNTEDMEYILDIGEIEIIDDVDERVVRKRRKIPPILIKKTYYVAIIYDRRGLDYDVYYRGWAENFPENTTTLKRIYTTDKTREAAEFPDLKLKKKTLK